MDVGIRTIRSHQCRKSIEMLDDVRYTCTFTKDKDIGVDGHGNPNNILFFIVGSLHNLVGWPPFCALPQLYYRNPTIYQLTGRISVTCTPNLSITYRIDGECDCCGLNILCCRFAAQFSRLDPDCALPQLCYRYATIYHCTGRSSVTQIGNRSL